MPTGRLSSCSVGGLILFAEIRGQELSSLGMVPILGRIEQGVPSFELELHDGELGWNDLELVESAEEGVL